MVRFPLVIAALTIAGCTYMATQDLNNRYGSAQPLQPTTQSAINGLDYQRDVQPILEQRCVVCHGCYDAPCQLKLESYEGLLRGASPQTVYQGTRLSAITPTRLYEDAQTTEAWRELGFHPVLNERTQTEEANLQAGVMAKMLELKQKQPLPDGDSLPDSFDFSLHRDQQCPKVEEFDRFARKYPLWGMPYGLPAIGAKEYQTLRTWLAKGAPGPSVQPLSDSLQEHITDWETWFNRDSKKARLVSRYLYEHLYIANLYFADQGQDTDFFRLVRSSTPPGEAIQRISTRRPYEDPEVDRVYYRLWHDPRSIVDKTHMPYLLNDARRQQWDHWFYTDNYQVTELPGYQPQTASNPFVTFQAIPHQARYQFLLSEAHFTIMNFIKGPVCRGNVAINVIQERFWVVFVEPEILTGPEFDDFLTDQSQYLHLPAENENSLWSLIHWSGYGKSGQKYLSAKVDFIRNNFSNIQQGNIDMLWDGDGHNPNAALTIFRHYDSATVEQGLIGNDPMTTWVIDYPILERIHYLLVAGFDVFGNVSHQTQTRLYMDFLRMESEMNFLAFLPPQARQQQLDRWYLGAKDKIGNYISSYFDYNSAESLYDYKTDNYKTELYAAIKKAMEPILIKDYLLESSGLSLTAMEALNTLQGLEGAPATLMPQISFINVRDGGLLTLLSDSAYTNISSLLFEDSRRLPEEDQLTVVNGLTGSYPNAFFELHSDDLPAFAEAIKNIRNETDYKTLLTDYGVRRNDGRFWAMSDEVHQKHQQQYPLRAGIFDYNRIENR